MGIGATSSFFPVTIDGNRFTGWDVGVSLSPYARGITVTDNRLDHDGVGITAATCAPQDEPSSGSITGNTVSHNTGDGISLGCGTWTVGGNRMVANAGLGFEADATAVITDAGGNVAKQNAEPQCVGLVCSPK